MSDDGIESDRGEREGDYREDGEQAAEDAVGPVSLLQLLLHSVQILDGKTVVDRLYLASEGLLKGRRRNRRAGGDGHAGGSFQAIGDINDGFALGSRLIVVGDVGDDADDGQPGL